MKTNIDTELLDQIISEHLKPIIQTIDEKAYYPETLLRAIGKAGFLASRDLEKDCVACREMYLVEEIARHCMTSAFTLWCHLAALASVRLSANPFVRNHLLPLLESGDIRGGTGLSNALKYYAGLETIRLKAERTDGGYIITGSLSSVSNLSDGHWFTILASLNHQQRVMCIIPVNTDGLVLEGKTNHIGLNGSATYACTFHNVFVSDEWILTDEADDFIKMLRPTLVLYQIPLGIGVSNASIQSILENYMRNLEANQYLAYHVKELMNEIQYIHEKMYQYANFSELAVIQNEILFTRLEMVKLTLKAVNADMLYSGGQAYLQGNNQFRRLREAYFLANLTPTVRQLETLFNSKT